ncbi:MBL fold metallo-hydrolase [Microtetraspora malaysiensis]|uniref:MBL fold metallo-hydrolase n=1 Tax=Microtetraspora malaysiensis TaxID=161358 RepID=UPI003D8F0D04
MKIHHLNVGSLREIEATYSALTPMPIVCHALLVETDDAGLVLVETGLGLDDVRRPEESLAADWVALTEPLLDPDETAVRQIVRLGHDPADVRDIVVTHLDVDHSGGLPDFPQARVHVVEAEYRAALAEAPSRRYRPAHWAHDPHWITYGSDGGQDWFGFPGARPLEGLPPEILLVPLGGHSAGHAGVAVRHDDQWLLHAGDAYFYHRELDGDTPHGHPLMDIVQHESQVDRVGRLDTQARLRALVREHGDEVTVVSAHDPWEFDRVRP